MNLRQRVPLASWTVGRVARWGLAPVILLLVWFVWSAVARQPLVIAVTRTLGTLVPPFEYETDRTRVDGLVGRPFCRRVPNAPTSDPSLAVAHCSVRYDKVVWLKPDPAARWSDGRSVDADSLRRVLAGIRARGLMINQPQPWSAEEVLGEWVVLTPTPNLPPLLLINLLANLPVLEEATHAGAQLQPDAGSGTAATAASPAVFGTGPFRVESVWRSTDPGPPPHPLPSLAGRLTDEVVLTRTSWWDRLFAVPHQIVVVGIDQPAEAATARALGLALDLSEVHALLNADSDLVKHLRTYLVVQTTDRQPTWRLDARPPDMALVAAVAPEGYLSPGCRERILDGLRRASRDPVFLRDILAQPAVTLTPPSRPVAWFQPGACPGPARDLALEICGGDLVTNAHWQAVGDALVRSLVRTDPGLQLRVRALPTQEESVRRLHREFAISMLAVVDQGRPTAQFLWENFLADWIPESLTQTIRKRAIEEARGTAPKLTLFLDEAAQHVVAVAVPQAHHAVSYRVRGIVPSTIQLDPTALALEAAFPLWIFPAGIGLLAALLLIIAFLLRRKQRADHARRRADQERREAIRQVRLLHHQLVAPLTTIMDWAAMIGETQPQAADEISREAREAVEFVHSQRTLTDPEQAELDAASTTRLGGDVIAKKLATSPWSRRQAEGLMQAPRLKLADDPPVALQRATAREVVQNLLDNAFKYRGGQPLRVEFVCEPGPATVIWRFRDWGRGIADDVPEVRLFEYGYRTPDAVDSEVQGAGLGLAFCERTIRRAGGTIRLTRRAGPTEFSLELPRARGGEHDPGSG